MCVEKKVVGSPIALPSKEHGYPTTIGIVRDTVSVATIVVVSAGVEI